jgi:hypothetical protein
MGEECEHGTDGPCGPCFDQHIAALTTERDALRAERDEWKRAHNELQSRFDLQLRFLNVEREGKIAFAIQRDAAEARAERYREALRSIAAMDWPKTAGSRCIALYDALDVARAALADDGTVTK